MKMKLYVQSDVLSVDLILIVHCSVAIENLRLQSKVEICYILAVSLFSTRQSRSFGIWFASVRCVHVRAGESVVNDSSLKACETELSGRLGY